MGSGTVVVIILDTNVVSELTRRESDENVVEWTERQDPGELWITSTTVSEIRLGMELMPPGRRRETMEDVNSRVLASFEDGTLSFETRAAQIYGRIVSRRAAAGRPINRDDAQIAASCVAAGAALATRNTRDFEGIEGLELINPFDPN
jgi:predicted nucleic acid-binding protein